MRINLIALGTRMPSWVNDGFTEYANRMPAHIPIKLHEIPLPKRTKQCDIKRLIDKEGSQMLAAMDESAISIALEVNGKPWSTEQLAKQLASWLQSGQNINLLIGGPDGLDPRVVATCQQSWSLSALTLPHPLVRIIVAEQLYRANTLLSGHPYHR